MVFPHGIDRCLPILTFPFLAHSWQMPIEGPSVGWMLSGVPGAFLDELRRRLVCSNYVADGDSEANATRSGRATI